MYISKAQKNYQYLSAFKIFIYASQNKKNNRIQTKMVSTFSTAVQFVGFFFFPEVHVQLILALILRLKRKNKLQD